METPPSEVAHKPRKRRLIVAAVVVLIAIVAGGFAYWWLSKPPLVQAAWLFEGAYAEYAGETTVSFVSVNLRMRLEVVEYNNTHAKLLTYGKMESNVMPEPVEWQNTTWTDFRTASYEVEGYDLVETHEDDVNIEGLGIKHCVVYRYTSPNMTMTYYVDKETTWPLRIEFTSTQDNMTIDFDLALKETNIPGLYIEESEVAEFINEISRVEFLHMEHYNWTYVYHYGVSGHWNISKIQTEPFNDKLDSTLSGATLTAPIGGSLGNPFTNQGYEHEIIIWVDRELSEVEIEAVRVLIREYLAKP